MNNYISHLMQVIVVVILCGCQSKNDVPEQVSAKNEIINTDSISSMQTIDSSRLPEIERSIESISKSKKQKADGILERVEDGGYPMFVIKINFPERAEDAYYNLNIESLPIDISSLDSFIGKPVSFEYLIEHSNDIYDIYFEGNSLLGEYSPEKEPNWNSISGILKGAETETMGDLPDGLTITTDQGKELYFEYFITPEMVAANTKLVTAYYSIGLRESIIDIRLAD